ncbi:MAG: trypsin-like peptidase domain-containing protein [Bacteroidota bacterium]
MRRSVFFLLLVVIASLIGAVGGSLLTLNFVERTVPYQSIEDRQNLKLTSYLPDSGRRLAGLNFEGAARTVTPAVVHIRATYGAGDFSLNPLEHYLNSPTRSSGSGVIISDDGYIVTNNHVIEDATNLEIVMNNNQRFFAKIIGRDPTTDLALLKIKSKNLPFVKYGNSDDIVPGEWVLAVGNPFDLNSTVTAGIVSAKARNIDILHDRNHLEVESFIQTDAAVNPGNSGGALVNLRGELIGINSAIATSTGTYSGYSFAIPVSLVKKIMDDLMLYGQVQRGLLGIQIQSVDADMAEDRELDRVRGVYVTHVNTGSAAEESGILLGDVIIAINGHEVNNVSELQEWVARNRPGQTIKVIFIRSGKSREVKAVLKNYSGSEEMEKPVILHEMEGATFEDLPYRELNALNIDGGVRALKVTEGVWQKGGLKEGFIITHIDKVNIDNVEDLNKVLSIKHGGMLVEGLYENGEKGVYGVNW